jgi:hypothetical protein
MDRILPLASPPPPARLFFLPDAAHAWREEVDGTTASLGVQHLSNAYFRKSLAYQLRRQLCCGSSGY